jgi:hypothetical protein
MRNTNAVRKSVVAVGVVASMLAMSGAWARTSPLITDPAGDTTGRDVGFGLATLPEQPFPEPPRDAADLLSGDIALANAALVFTQRVVEVPPAANGVHSSYSFGFTHDGLALHTIVNRDGFDGGVNAAVWRSDECDLAPAAATVDEATDTVTVTASLADLNAMIERNACDPAASPIGRGSVFTNLTMRSQAFATLPSGTGTNVLATTDHAEAAPGTTYTVK